MFVIILSTSGNEHANAVEREVMQSGGEVVRMDMDTAISNKSLLSLSQELVRWGDKELRPCEISGIFVHHPLVNIPEEIPKDSLDSEIILSSWRNLLDWLEATLPDSLWMNKPSASRTSVSPLKQLKIAHEVGFAVPSSCFTNDVAFLEEFAEKHPSIVVKPGPLGIHMPQRRILAHIVDVPALPKANLIIAPCFFQSYVEKEYELRVHVIRDEIYACKIDSQSNEKTRVDWRNYDIAHTPHWPFELDGSIADMCRRITTQLGLTFGVLDLIVAKDGTTVFLECNSQGHWIWIEELTRLPITKAVSRALLNGSGS